MPLPHAVARFNRRVTNRFIEPIARRSSGFAVVHHVGRSTGTVYRTPVNLFKAGDSVIVALTYGPTADWARNVLGSGGSIENQAGPRAITAAAVVGRPTAWPHLPAPVRGALRVLRVRDFLQLSTEAPAISPRP